ncbi:exo-1,3-beta-glucanase [Acarospora aff. strigata]|nr:exo-1,3-beta-glucanase [Acarospora aff. strigata]
MIFPDILRQVACTLALLAVRSEAAPKFQLDSRELTFDYNNNKVRGVNLGGWLVLEPWITPSIFEEWSSSRAVVDEYTYTQVLGRTEASNRLNRHWNTWITQDDFNRIAAAGLNHVRIPIGYWAIAPLPGDPYVQGQLAFMDNAIGWARSAGLKVMIDLHGAPGSQNGFDNSGRLGPIQWQQGDTVSQTLNAIRGLAQRYASNTDVVTAIQLLNEPFGYSLNLDLIKKFYYDGWGTIRDSNRDTTVVIHDAFQDFLGYWNGFMNSESGVNHVMLDTHQYQIFDNGQVAQSPPQHISSACAIGRKLSSCDKWTVVGEWTGAQTDCAKWLNGLGKGARYDGTLPDSSYVGSCNGKYTGTVAGLSADDKFNLRHFIEAQLDAYERRTGWFFWTWKTESAPEWHMKDLLANGLFPQPLTSRQYPNQCGF